MGETLFHTEAESSTKEQLKTIQDVFYAFERGEITEEQAVKIIEDLRNSRHSKLERYLTFLTARG